MSVKSHFVYKLIPPRATFATDMSEAEAAIMAKHVGYWKALLEQGSVVAFGPVLEPAGLWGLAVVEADTEADIHQLGAHDRAVTSGMATVDVFPMPRAIVRPLP